MATRQYVGARYVPKFAEPIGWVRENSYEALTIVTYLNNSYTSKKPVPPNTDITNEDYWVVTGNYNAQVEEYRKSVETLSTNLDSEIVNRENADNVLSTNLRNETINRENADNEIIETIEIRRNVKDVICIGDSYGVNYAGWSGWGYEFAKIYQQGKVYVGATGGAGWVNASEGRNFLQTLQYVVDNNPSMVKKDITDIVVLGGYNDMSTSLTANACATAMATFKEYCYTHFPNARVHFGCVGMDYKNPYNEYKLLQTYGEDIYPSTCSNSGINYYNRFKYILLDSQYVFIESGNPNSYFHPNTAGCKQIAKYLYRYLELGNFDVIYGNVVMGSSVYTRNGITNITPHDAISIFTETDAKSKTFPFNTWVEVKDLGDNALNLWGGVTADRGSAATIASGTVKWVDFSNGKVHYLKYKLGWHKLFFNNVTSTETFNPSTLSSNSGYIIEPITCDELIAI